MIGFDNQSMQQRIEQFDVKHGGVAVTIDGWHVYPTGAMREVSPWGALLEPPSDHEACCRVQLKYHETLLKRATYEFDHLKDHLVGMARNGLDNPSELQKLKELQRTVLDRKQKADAIREEINNNPQVAARQQSKADTETRKQRLTNELKAIEI